MPDMLCSIPMFLSHMQITMSSPFIWYEKPCELRWSLPCRFNTGTMSILCVDESYFASARKIQPRQNKWMKISASRDQLLEILISNILHWKVKICKTKQKNSSELDRANYLRAIYTQVRNPWKIKFLYELDFVKSSKWKSKSKRRLSGFPWTSSRLVKAHAIDLSSVARAVQKSITTWQVSKYREAASEKFPKFRNN